MFIAREDFREVYCIHREASTRQNNLSLKYHLCGGGWIKPKKNKDRANLHGADGSEMMEEFIKELT
jgi:hypothetical protein